MLHHVFLLILVILFLRHMVTFPGLIVPFSIVDMHSCNIQNLISILSKKKMFRVKGNAHEKLIPFAGTLTCFEYDIGILSYNLAIKTYIYRVFHNECSF